MRKLQKLLRSLREFAGRAEDIDPPACQVEILDYGSCLEIARGLRSHGKIEEAIHTLQKAIGRDPRRPEAFNLLGECLEARGEVLGAQRVYRAALALEPTFRPALLNLHRTVSTPYLFSKVRA